jgi:hypothetical protein
MGNAIPNRIRLEKRLQISGVLLIAGLVVEALCLLWARPIGFVLLVAVAGVLLFAGLVVYLLSLVSTAHRGD